MEPIIGKYWLLAARAGFASPGAWQQWADEQIMAVPTPPSWILSMSTAADLQHLQLAVEEAFDNARGDTANVKSHDDVVIGYLWWRHLRGELSLRECLRLAGEFADAGDSRYACEDIYDLLNELEGGAQDVEIEQCASELLSPVKEVAQKQWRSIQKPCGGLPPGK